MGDTGDERANRCHLLRLNQVVAQFALMVRQTA